MPYELGVAYLPIVPETSKIAPGIKSALGDATKGVDKQGSAMGGMLATGLKTSVKAAGIGAAIVGAFAVKGGISRLMGIEDARASLSGLGHDAAGIDAIMSNALAAVKGTAFGMADAGKAAASAVAAGVKPGADLERTLRLVGDAATIANTDLGAMAAVFNKVAASNKVQMDSINQLHDAGVPALQLLAAELGVTSEEASKMASAGQIDFATFQNAMEDGMGGAALKSGETLRGSLANLQASLGRVGAGFMEGVYPKIAPALQKLTGGLGGAEDGAADLGARIGTLTTKYVIPGVKAMGSAVKVAWDYKAVVATLVAGLVAYRVATKAAALYQAIYTAGTAGATAGTWSLNAALRANPIGAVVTALTLLGAGLVLAYNKSTTFKNIVNATWAAIKTGLSVAWSYIQPVLSSIASWIGSWLPEAFDILKTVVGVAFGFIKTYVSGWWSVASTVFQAAWWYISNVLAPVFTWLWQNIIGPAFSAIGDVISWAWNNIISPVFNALSGGVGYLVTAFTSAKDGIKGAWDLLVGVVEGPINVAKGIIGGFIDLINGIPGVTIPNPFGAGGKTIGRTGKGNHLGAARQGIGYASGGWTGPGSKYTPAGLVHADEFVVKKESRRKIEKQAPGVLDFMNRTGLIPLHGSYAGGGRVVPGTGKQHKSGYPWATWAGDYPNPTGTPVNAWKSGVIALVKSMTTSYGKHIRMNHGDGTSSLYAHLSSFAKSVGDRVSQGEMIGRVGSTGNSTGPHLHFEALGGSFDSMASGGSIWDSITGAGDQIGGWIKSKLLDKANIGGLFGNVGGLFGSVGNGVKDWVLDKLFDSGGLAAGTGFMAKNTIAPERVLSDRQTRAFEQMVRHNFGDDAAGGIGSVELSEDSIRRLGDYILAGSRNVAASTVSDFSDRRRTDELWGTR